MHCALAPIRASRAGGRATAFSKARPSSAPAIFMSSTSPTARSCGCRRRASLPSSRNGPGNPTASRSTKDGRIFIADHKEGLMLLDPQSGKVEIFLDRPRRERFKGLNDLVFAKNGDLYFTDQGEADLRDPAGRLFRLRADGTLDLLLSNVPSPNGLVLTPNEEILYLAVTRGNAVWRVPLNPDGSLGRVGIFIQLSGGTGPDGMAMDSEGNLAICHVGMGSVWLFRRLGRPLYELPSCTGHATTNAAYGGTDGRTLYITESETGTILQAKLDTPGLTLYSHQ